MTKHETRTVPAGVTSSLNGTYHRPALTVFLLIVLAHWAEHLVQAAQIWVLGWPRPEARGLLGMPFPVLVEQEWLHYGYALVMLAGFWVLRGGFVGRGRSWWLIALAVQIWHHLEHLLLLVQALTGTYIAGRAAPTSLLQLVLPRVELHLFYNAAVFLPMVVAMYYHLRPSRREREQMTCGCLPRVAVQAG
ncbi:hypothetical protein [Micromonospora sp. NPDC126480]|uniref:hypothetical protein n=1 Tax=Micromonospora sp. NPDC126480 TaxID=3155312 RepID=UPI0033308613